ncbi:MAG: helix-turn-helix domain-containing protein [Eubacterium sp.]|nr:helix-turn-helix domain-containing protein [Eubacterium sp.]
MSNRSIGEMISYLRKEKGMTQNDLAEIVNVTDKAVSKWERNLSCPDINSIPKLAEVLGVSADELLNAKKSGNSNNGKVNDIINTALLGIGVAMGICVIVTSVLNEINPNSALAMLGIGLSSLGIYLLKNKNNKQ